MDLVDEKGYFLCRYTGRNEEFVRRPKAKTKKE